MLVNSLIAASVLAGAALFLYFYHFRPKIVDQSDREALPAWPAYEYIDWYLKLSTVGVTVAVLLTDHWLLFEMYDSWIMVIAGGLLAAGGLALFIAAMLNLGKQYSPAHQSKAPTSIVRTGPYRYIRHPIYTSNLLLLAGLTAATGSMWILLNLGILIAYYLPTIRREEQAIAERFAEYREYMQHTGRFLPRLFSSVPQ